MSPAFKIRSRTLFSAAAALALGLQVAPWPTAIQAQEFAPAPLIVQSQARPIAPAQQNEPRQFNNAQRPAQQSVQPRSGGPQYPKTEVQKELEKLYEQNGRAVPEMVEPKFSTPAAGQAGAAAAPLQSAPPQYAQPQKAQPVSAPKKKGLLSKLFGSKEDGPTQPPAEPPYTPPMALPAAPPAMVKTPPAAPATGLPNYGQIFNQPGAAPQQPQQFAQQPQSQPPMLQTPVPQQPLLQAPPVQQPPAVVAIPPSQTPVLNLVPQTQTPAVTNDGLEAPLFVENPPAAASNGLPQIDFNAPLDEPATDTVDLGQPAPLTTVAKPVEPADPFSDDALFPGSTPPTATSPAAVPNDSVAVESNSVEPDAPAVEEAVPNDNPYSGLTLDADPFSNPSALKTATAAPREIPVDDAPVSEETVETSPPALMIPPDQNADSQVDLADQPERKLITPDESPASDEPPLVVEESGTAPPAQLTRVPRTGSERTQAKQEMIAARKGLRGLKGFCPVVLRDDRDLVDAHSQFRVVYNSKTYYLSSSQAVSAFHLDPAKYAPAARGCDVIHQAITGEEMEGSLDFAVWYKGRLYLFSSAETMDTFVSAPSSHATLD